MKRLQAFKFRLQPNGAEIRQMQQFSGNTRKIWNLALARQQQEHEAGNKFTHHFGMNGWLIDWKKEYDYLKKSPSQTLQQVTKDLSRAFKNFFEKRAEFPKFKKKGFSNSFRLPQGCHLEQQNSRIFLPKLGWIRYRNSQEVLGTIKNVTVSQTNKHWFMAIQTEREMEAPAIATSPSIGIDMGITRFATLSDTTYLEPLNSFKKKQQTLARYRCGHVSAENRQTQAQFLCVACGYANNADVVGAINILERGHRLLACGEMMPLGHSMNQEPTEAIHAIFA